jgi:phospholipase/lecithinase/hemolysin
MRKSPWRWGAGLIAAIGLLAGCGGGGSSAPPAPGNASSGGVIPSPSPSPAPSPSSSPAPAPTPSPAPAAGRGRILVAGDTLTDAGTFGYKFTVQGTQPVGAGSTVLWPDVVASNLTNKKLDMLCPYYRYDAKNMVNPFGAVDQNCTNYAVGGAFISEYANENRPSLPKQFQAMRAPGSFASNDLIMMTAGVNDINKLATLLLLTDATTAPLLQVIQSNALTGTDGKTYAMTGCPLTDTNVLDQKDPKTFAGQLLGAADKVGVAANSLMAFYAATLGQEYVDKQLGGVNTNLAATVTAIQNAYYAAIFPCFFATTDATAQNTIKSLLTKAIADTKSLLFAAAVDYGGVLANTLADSVQNQLIAQGAKRVVLLNLPAIEVTPKFNRIIADIQLTQGKEAADINKNLFINVVAAYNNQLNKRLGATPEVLIVDFYTVFKTLVNDPAPFKLTDVSNPVCLPLASETGPDGKTRDAWNAPLAATPAEETAGYQKVFTGCTADKVQAYLQSKNLPADFTPYTFADNAFPTATGHTLVGFLVLGQVLNKGW